MRQARIYHYTLPVNAGLFVRDQPLTEREGLVVELSEGAQRGWGEVAPLPGFSQETFAEARHALIAATAVWCDHRNIAMPQLPPSVAWGLSIAQAELDKRLPTQSSFRHVPVCTGDPDALLVTLGQQPAGQPYEAKIKVGEYEVARDRLMIATMLEALPDLRLRLDANRRWQPEQLASFWNGLSEAHQARIHWIEEPCRDPNQSLVQAQALGYPLAWDESLIDSQDMALLENDRVSTWVIKPSLLGDLATIEQWVSWAHALGKTAVISSALETSLGLTQLSRLADWLTPGVVPGLDTLGIYQHQLDRTWPGASQPLSPLHDQPLVWINTL
ncbi:o-succinylbenzoate synthase [Salinivibrio kushneri]|uniref:o-succinylbenzoate synthase n=1 Tax=Salinivibrio kushneri TaxID=1908198 RepID=A0AB36KA86_9GAMM|nr:o-succinylbenzoate synthase [Salinivibrio kushneri]OOE44923.1 o-succinylbenzoate synthase [Salinivibrio kushneri]OOE46590.1 o-succinylbenzoate synthase [Salinivibrio kushneri]